MKTLSRCHDLAKVRVLTHQKVSALSDLDSLLTKEVFSFSS